MSRKLLLPESENRVRCHGEEMGLQESELFKKSNIERLEKRRTTRMALYLQGLESPFELLVLRKNEEVGGSGFRFRREP